MLYYSQTNRQEVYEMTAPKKPPITKSFGYAFEGIFTCIRKERNMKIHCIMAVLVVIAGIILKLSPVEWCICLGLFGLVMALELVNTAVESVVAALIDDFQNTPAGHFLPVHYNIAGPGLQCHVIAAET